MSRTSCPNCDSTNLRSTKKSSGGEWAQDWLPGVVGIFRRAKVEIVVCCNCGLTRLFLDNEAIGRVMQSSKWEPWAGKR